MIKEFLSYLGGYFNSNTFKLDLCKMADYAEMSEDEFLNELNELHKTNDIIFKNDEITLVTIKPILNKNFNESYKPIEEMICKPGEVFKIDKVG